MRGATSVYVCHGGLRRHSETSCEKVKGWKTRGVSYPSYPRFWNNPHWHRLPAIPAVVLTLDSSLWHRPHTQRSSEKRTLRHCNKRAPSPRDSHPRCRMSSLWPPPARSRPTFARRMFRSLCAHCTLAPPAVTSNTSTNQPPSGRIPRLAHVQPELGEPLYYLHQRTPPVCTVHGDDRESFASVVYFDGRRVHPLRKHFILQQGAESRTRTWCSAPRAHSTRQN